MTETRLRSLKDTNFYIIKSLKDLLDEKIDYKFFGLDAEYFYYFISRFFYYFNLLNTSNEEYIYLYNHNERNLYGRFTEKIGNTRKRLYIYDKVKKVLHEKNIIYESGYDASNHTARLYKFTNTTQKRLNDDDLEIINLKVKKTKLKKQCQNLTISDYNSYLQYNLLTSDRFSIDIMSARDFIKNSNISNHKKKFNLLNIDNIANKEIFVSRGKNNNRIISSFTNLKSNIRKFCYIDGKELQSIDLQSSQLTLFVHYLKNKYNNPEVLKFYNLVTEGDVYEHFLQRSKDLNLEKYKIWNSGNFSWDYIEIKERRDVKREIFNFLYSKIKVNNSFKKYLEIDFPNVYKIIIDEKRLRRKTKMKNMAVELQKLESNIFIPVSDKYITKGALTVHDSIYFVPELYDDILKDLKISFKNNKIDKFILK